MIKYNPLLKSNGTQNGALLVAPSDSIVFDVPGKCIWVKGVKLLGTDHTYSFSNDNYITLTNTPGDPEDIKIGVNINNLLSELDKVRLYIGENNNTAANAQVGNPYIKLFYNNVRKQTFLIKSANDTNLTVTTDSNGNIIIENKKPDLNHNTDYRVSQLKSTDASDFRVLLKSTADDTNETNSTKYSQYLTFNPNTKILKINSSLVVTMADIYVGATSSANATAGLVPAAASAQRNYFLRGDGTWATPSFTIDNKAATIGTTLTTIATINGIDITAKIGSYAASSHTHFVKINGSEKTIAAPGGAAVDLGSYLPLAGGTMNAGAMIVWQDWGQWGASSPTYPKANGGLQWSGTSDNLKLFVEETASDDLRLILQCGDDASPQFNIRNYAGTTTVSLHSNGTITGTSIVNSGSNDNYVLLGGGGTKLISDFATSGHTHSLSIAADSGTSSIALAASTKYKLTAGGSTYVFTSTPDEKVKQTPKTDNANRPLMMINGGTSAGELTSTSMFSTGIYANASSKMITANGFIKNSYDDTSVLLAGGGAKALDDFSLTGHNHDERYNKRTTYDWYYELNGTGPFCLGKFCLYDSTVIINIKAGNGVNNVGTLVINTWNKGTSGGQCSLYVYGDPNGDLTSRLRIYNHPNPDPCVEVYYDCGSYTKMFVHIQALNLMLHPYSNPTYSANYWDLGINSSIPSLAVNTNNVNMLLSSTSTWALSTTGNAATATNADKLDNVHLDGIFTDLSKPNNSNNISLTIGGVTKSITLGSNAWNSDAYVNKYTYTLAGTKTVRITYTGYTPVLINACAGSGGALAMWAGTGYYYAGWTRNLFRSIIYSSVFPWCLTDNSSTQTSIEIKNTRTSENATITVISSESVTFTEISDLTKTKVENKTLLTSSDLSPSISAGTATNTVKITVAGVDSGNYTIPYSSNSGALSDYTIDNFMRYDNSNSSYLAAGLSKDYAIKAASKYIEFWDGYEGAGWFNFKLGILYATSGVQVYSNNTWKNVSLEGHNHDSLYVTAVGQGSGDYATLLYYTKNSTNNYFTVAYATHSNTTDRFKYTGDNWNVNYASNVVNLISNTSGSTSGRNSPTGYSSGISIMTSYVGFLLAVHGGGGDALYFRKMLDNGNWHDWYTVYHSGNLSVNNATLTLTAGTTSKTFTANASTDVSFTVPDVSKSTKGLCPILPNETTVTKFLRLDGTWLVPAYPTVNNGSLYLQASGTTKTTFTANLSGNSTFNIATGSSNGTISVGGTDVAVKGLGSNAYTSDPYLIKTTYDYHKEFSAGGSSYIEIGCFSLYDSMVGIDVTLTTSSSWNGRLVISSLNINSSGGGSYYATVRGDNSISMHNKFSIVRSGTYFRVYLNCSGWMKVFCHIWCVAASASELFTTVSSMPTGNITINNDSGTFGGNVYASHFYESSDIRLKHDISMLSKSIRRFRFNDDNKLYYGFIAQELETLHPELVDNSGEYKTVNYNSAICYYIAELENRVKMLEDKLRKYEEMLIKKD